MRAHISSNRSQQLFGSFWSLLAAAITALFFSQTCLAQQLSFTPLNNTGIYNIRENAGWTIDLPEGTAVPVGRYTYTVKKNNFEVVKTGQLDFLSNNGKTESKLEIALDEPAMLYVEVTPPANTGDDAKSGDASGPTTANPPAAKSFGQRRNMILGAAIAPTKLRPDATRPADFDQFWEAKVKALQAVPENAQLTPGESGKTNVEYAAVKMDHLDGKHVYGQIARPKTEGSKIDEPNADRKFPALVIFQWASPPYPLQKSWVTDRAAEGWLTLNIEPHDVLPTEPQSYYAALPQAIKNYQSIGNDDRDQSYFLQMYLADYRAVDYLASRPDWDGKTLVVMGTSMGGQQSLCVAGPNPKITHVIVNEPAGCDTNGPLHGRQSGYPNFPSNNPEIMETALYFDAVNFAPHIKATTLVAMGFVDTIAPLAGIWTAFNQIPGPKEAAPMIDSPHNNLATPAQQRPYTKRSAEWLAALVNGEKVEPKQLAMDPGSTANAKDESQKSSPPATGNQTTSENAARPARPNFPSAANPVPRADANSKLAHEQLLEKAKQGGIDVYFLGDSITRRWGTSDTQYRDLMANWKQNFFGRNAGNFGWGADSIQNVLWRIENGELDGVNPKVIVILAGTNNVGTRPADDAKVTDITAGLKAVVETCRQKAPQATIILTAIFPRNDNLAVMPSINKINADLAQLCDGKIIRFLNVNDKLADENGKLFDGMMNADKLHPAVKGYQVWADGLNPILTELLGPPATEDHAPPPTGDPSARGKKDSKATDGAKK